MDHSHPQASQMRLYNRSAERLYLNNAELARFIATANLARPTVRRFALTMAYTGCRLSEARYLRFGSVQLEERVISITSLKKRQHHCVREVPMPVALVDAFESIQGKDEALIFEDFGRPVPRTTAYRWIKRLMTEAGIEGPRACPRGLRHAYGTRAVLSGVPLHMLQLWMGHAAMRTTAIYATVLGPDQLALADRMW